MGHRPKRGAAGPDIEIGDPFGQYEYQGGAAPGASESGDLQSREFGVPQADIPGGLNHLVNTEAHPVKPPKTPQQQPVINDHGVPPVERRRQFDEAVPVRIEKDPDIRNPIWKLISEGPHTVTGPTAEPIRLADRDPNRVKFWICNETTATGAGQTGPLFRIGDWETTSDQRGLAIPAATIKDFVTQDSIYLFVASGVTVTYSLGFETEIEGTG